MANEGVGSVAITRWRGSTVIVDAAKVLRRVTTISSAHRQDHEHVRDDHDRGRHVRPSREMA